MATAVTDPVEPGGSRRRRRRARREAEAAALAAAELPAAGNGSGHANGNGEAAQDVAGQFEPEPQPPVPASPQPDPAAEALPAPPDTDEFRDLLGQAVGLRLDAVTREFGGRNEMHVTALKNVTLDVGPCEFVAIVGPSGCGKTTLLSLMGGLDRPSTGHVYGAGLPLGELPDHDLSDYRLQRVSTIFQTFNLIPSMTVEDNVALPLTLAGVELEERRKRAHHLLDLVGLRNRARTRVGRLSGGEQQKVAVARALANRPGLILADEPTGSLDSTAGEGVLDLLVDLNRRGATVVLVTHDPEVARHAKRVVRMIDGQASELDAGRATVRAQEPIDPPSRMHWKDTLKVGLGSAGRRPLRTILTTTGVAIGIAALSLIVALAGGLADALNSPALGTSQVHQVAVYPVANAVTPAFNQATLNTFQAMDHVRAAWGQIGMNGTYSGGPNLGSSDSSVSNPTGALVSLPLMSGSSALPTLIAGRMPGSEIATEALLTDGEAHALGFSSAPAALGARVNFTAASGSLVPALVHNQVTRPLALTLKVVGVISNNYIPAGEPGALAPNGIMRSYWSSLAIANGWKGGEYASITLLADSGLNVESLRRRVDSLGFQTQTFGDQFRNFEDLLGKLRVALLGLALVALLLACLGIANTMYTAVLERTKEIGVLKALGARSRDVMLLFLAEALGIGLAGGVVGALVAVGLGRLGNAAVDQLTQSVSGTGVDVFRTDVPVVLVAVVLAAVLSTISGLLPAVRAARQDPARALRYE